MEFPITARARSKRSPGIIAANDQAYEIYSDIRPNPTIENVLAGVAAYKASGADYMITVAAVPLRRRRVLNALNGLASRAFFSPVQNNPKKKRTVLRTVLAKPARRAHTSCTDKSFHSSGVLDHAPGTGEQLSSVTRSIK